jgi:phosphoglucosamine mutase
VSIPTFGTDGVRGRANHELTPEVAMALGRAAAELLDGDRFVVGTDTRQSCAMLQAALTAGICATGHDVEILGVVPTPVVAWAATDRGAPGAMISASHNPFGDNGIKLFAMGGMKLRDDVEVKIEARYLELMSTSPSTVGDRSGSDRVGLMTTSHEAEGWVDHVVSTVNGGSDDGALAGLSVVLDCANGAAYRLGPEVFRRLGADVTVVGAEPNGVNINDGVGSTHPETLARTVTEIGADVGLAFDGDADRVIAIDGTGTVVDGDRVLAILALDWAARGRLRRNTVVVTVMTNLGFHRAMAHAGIEVVSTAVGDRYVLAALDDGGFSLGGEQSGHVICRDLATTGDGVLAGVQLLDVVVRSGRSLAELAGGVMTTVPQLLENVRLPRRDPDAAAALVPAVEAVEREFGSDGRVVVRASGTEPLLRVMVEHIDPDVARSACDRLIEAARRTVT